MNNTLRTIGIIAMLALGTIKLIQYLDKPLTNRERINKHYEPEWQNAEVQMESMIRDQLKENSISACLDLYVKKSRDGEGGMALACTDDGEHYNFYILDYRVSRLDKLNDDGIVKPKSLKY